jgi:hypothetical protein
VDGTGGGEDGGDGDGGGAGGGAGRVVSAGGVVDVAGGADEDVLGGADAVGSRLAVGGEVAVPPSVGSARMASRWVRARRAEVAGVGAAARRACWAASRFPVSCAAAAAATPVAATADTVTRPVMTVRRRTARSRACGVNRAWPVARVTPASFPPAGELPLSLRSSRRQAPRP